MIFENPSIAYKFLTCTRSERMNSIKFKCTPIDHIDVKKTGAVKPASCHQKEVLKICKERGGFRFPIESYFVLKAYVTCTVIFFTHCITIQICYFINFLCKII